MERPGKTGQGRWLVVIPDWLPERLNVLLRRHWSVRARRAREAADMVATYARLADVPRATGRRRVSLRFSSPRTPADPDARLKLLLDGLVAAGMLVDDSPAMMSLTGIESEKGRKETRITLEDDMAELFDQEDEKKFARLRELGWVRQEGEKLFGQRVWRSPETGGLYEESEALKWLERHERGKA